jgi:hypothetical protein
LLSFSTGSRLGRDKGGRGKKMERSSPCVSVVRTAMIALCRAFLPKAHGKDCLFFFFHRLAGVVLKNNQ